MLEHHWKLVRGVVCAGWFCGLHIPPHHTRSTPVALTHTHKVIARLRFFNAGASVRRLDPRTPVHRRRGGQMSSRDKINEHNPFNITVFHRGQFVRFCQGSCERLPNRLGGPARRERAVDELDFYAASFSSCQVSSGSGLKLKPATWNAWWSSSRSHCDQWSISIRWVQKFCRWKGITL